MAAVSHSSGKKNRFNLERRFDKSWLDAVSQAQTGFCTFFSGQIRRQKRSGTGWARDICLTSNGIRLFCPVSLKAWARRKTSSTPTPRAKKGNTCWTDIVSVTLLWYLNKSLAYSLEGSSWFLFSDYIMRQFYKNKSHERNKPTCVVAALKVMPRREQRPRPAATDNVTNRTPASPTAPWDLAQSHRSIVRHA